jgi:hypothetical protein
VALLLSTSEEDRHEETRTKDGGLFVLCLLLRFLANSPADVTVRIRRARGRPSRKIKSCVTVQFWQFCQNAPAETCRTEYKSYVLALLDKKRRLVSRIFLCCPTVDGPSQRCTDSRCLITKNWTISP